MDRFPEKRRGINTTYGMGDIDMAAVSVFFKVCPPCATNASSRQGTGVPTAPAYSASPRSRLTVISATSSTRPGCIRPSPKPSIRSGAPTAASTCSAGPAATCWSRSTAPRIIARARSIARTVQPGAVARAKPNISTACCQPRWWRSEHDKVIPPEPDPRVKPEGRNSLSRGTGRIELPIIERTVRRGKQRFVHRDRWLHDGPLLDPTVIAPLFVVGRKSQSDRWGGRPPTASMCQSAGRWNRRKGSRPP